MADGHGGYRWGRIVAAAVLIEVILALLAAVVFSLSAEPGELLNALVPPISFGAALLVAAWLFRAVERPVAHGIAAGIVCLAIYLLMAGAGFAFAPDRVDLGQSFGAPYLASHLLKVLGGAAGGYWVIRRRLAA